MTNQEQTKLVEKANAFAANMRRIPRRVLRCEVYGTARVVVDQAHALNILRRVVDASITQVTAYQAINILQDRLDAKVTS